MELLLPKLQRFCGRASTQFDVDRHVLFAGDPPPRRPPRAEPPSDWFGTINPRLYEAMFTLPATVSFDSDDTPPQLQEAFSALSEVIAAETPQEDVAVAAELYWACCHGLVTLLNARRIPSERIEDHTRRVAALIRMN